MNAAEVRDLPTEEIQKQLVDAERALFNLRFQRESEQLEKPDQLRKAKRDIARFLTILREREIEDVRNERAAAQAES